MSIVMLIVGSMIFGAFGGVFYGFCRAGHEAGVSGLVTSQNRFLRLITAQADNLSFGQAVLFLVAIALSLVIFFGAMFMPLFLMSWLGIPSGIEPLAYVALFVAGAIGWHVGKRLWVRVS